MRTDFFLHKSAWVHYAVFGDFERGFRARADVSFLKKFPASYVSVPLESTYSRAEEAEAAEKTRERKKDVRRKILLGALVLERLRQGDPRAESLRAGLDGYLTRDNDRALFELSPLPEKEGEKKVTETA